MQLVERDQPGAPALVNVVRVVSDLVSEIAKLRLQAGLGPVKESARHPAGLRRFDALGVGARAVLEYAFAGFEREVQSIKARITLFQLIDHAQTLQVVLEAALPCHAI